MPPLHHFLIVFDNAEQCLIEHRDLGVDSAAAMRVFRECEGRYGMRQGIEIVLVGADSLDTIRRTHSHYFEHSSDDPFAELALNA